MGFGLAEDLVDEVVTYLEANLAAKLAALDAEYPDSIALQMTVATQKGLKSLEEIPNYPVLYALSPAGIVRPRMISESSSEVDARPELSVGIVVLEQDSETLQKRLYRYGRALTELLIDGWGSNSLNNWQFLTSEDWNIDMQSGTFARESVGSFIGEVTLTVRGSRLEGLASDGVAYSPAVQLDGAIASDTTVIQYASTGDPIQVFDVIRIDSEKMVVSAVTPAANLMNVGRGYRTTPAAHADLTAILFVRNLG